MLSAEYSDPWTGVVKAGVLAGSRCGVSNVHLDNAGPSERTATLGERRPQAPLKEGQLVTRKAPPVKTEIGV